MTGVVEWFNDSKGFGFIRLDSAQKKDQMAFVHYSEIQGMAHKTLNAGDKVECAVYETLKGLCARDVKKL